MKGLFTYFAFIVFITISISIIFSENQKNKFNFIPPKPSNDNSVQLMKNKADNLLNKFVTQQRINEIDTQEIKEDLQSIKTKQTEKNEFNYSDNERYYVEWH